MARLLLLLACAAAVTLAAGTRGGLVSGAHADAEPGQQQVLAPVGGEQHAADSSDTMTPDERLKAAEALKKKITALSAKLLAHGSAAVQAVSDEEKTLRTLRYKLAKHKAAGKVEKAKLVEELRRLTQEVASMKLRLDAAMQVRRDQEAAGAASGTGAAHPLDASVKVVNPLLEAGKTLNDIPALQAQIAKREEVIHKKATHYNKVKADLAAQKRAIQAQVTKSEAKLELLKKTHKDAAKQLDAELQAQMLLMQQMTKHGFAGATSMIRELGAGGGPLAAGGAGLEGGERK